MCLAGVLATGTVHAHHTAAAVFSTDDIEIEGFVTEFNFKNPHLNIVLAVTDENGVETEWMATGPGLDGMWLGSRQGIGRNNPPLNARAAAEQERFDPFEDDPAFTECADAGLVRQAATIRPLRITQHDDRLVFEYEEFAARRVIYLDGRGPEREEHTLFGYHTARYEGDALIIETTQLLGNLSGPLGNALSDRATTVETYGRVDDPASGPAIELRMVITDPGNLTSTWEIGTIKYYTTDPYDFVEVDCRLPYKASGQRQSPEGNQVGPNGRG